MNTDYRPTNSWDFRLRAAKLGELVNVRSLAALSLTVALIALLATLAAYRPCPYRRSRSPSSSTTRALVGEDQQQRLSSSELRNGCQRGWLHGLRG